MWFVLFLIGLLKADDPEFFYSLLNHKSFHSIYSGPSEEVAKDHTWKTHPIFSESVYNPAKFHLTYINEDAELDMYVFENGKPVSWINNVRGSSLHLKPSNVTSHPASSMDILDFDKDFIEDVLTIDQSGKKIYMSKKVKTAYSVYQQDPEWEETVLFDLEDQPQIQHSLPKNYKMTSMVFHDNPNKLTVSLLLTSRTLSLVLRFQRINLTFLRSRT